MTTSRWVCKMMKTGVSGEQQGGVWQWGQVRETNALSPFGTFKLDLDRSWARVQVRDSGEVGLAVREESTEFIWVLNYGRKGKFREKRQAKNIVFFLCIWRKWKYIYMHLLALIFQRSGICMYNHGFWMICLEAGQRVPLWGKLLFFLSTYICTHMCLCVF